jgi:hypothetical protein
MESLPFAMRVAAGVVAESIDVVRKLPTEISTLPVTVMGTLAKLSFQLNQQLTDLASAGDRLIAGIRGGEEPPERTAWATIDDDSETARDDPQAAATWENVADAREDDVETSWDRLESVPDLPLADLDAETAAELVTDQVHVVFDETEELTHPLVEDLATLELIEGEAGESDLPEEPRPLTLSELRTAVREMTADEVQAALDNEQQGRARPAHLTLLSNRLTTLARSDG